MGQLAKLRWHGAEVELEQLVAEVGSHRIALKVVVVGTQQERMVLEVRRLEERTDWVAVDSE